MFMGVPTSAGEGGEMIRTCTLEDHVPSSAFFFTGFEGEYRSNGGHVVMKPSLASLHHIGPRPQVSSLRSSLSDLSHFFVPLLIAVIFLSTGISHIYFSENTPTSFKSYNNVI